MNHFCGIGPTNSFSKAALGLSLLDSDHRFQRGLQKTFIALARLYNSCLTLFYGSFGKSLKFLNHYAKLPIIFMGSIPELEMKRYWYLGTRFRYLVLKTCRFTGNQAIFGGEIKNSHGVLFTCTKGKISDICVHKYEPINEDIHYLNKSS